jgi:YbbR domain-containing protein
MRRRDWATYGLSLVIAVFLWYYVVARDNITEVFRVPVEVTGLPERVIATCEPAIATVTVVGAREIVSALTAEDVRVRARPPSHQPGTYSAPLRATVPRGVSARINRSQATVTLKQIAEPGAEVRLMTRAVPIALTSLGQPAPGYYVYRIEVAPTIATITGPEERVRHLPAVPTDAVNLEGVREDVVTRVALVPPAGVAVITPTTVSVVVGIRPGLPPERRLPEERSP